MKFTLEDIIERIDHILRELRYNSDKNLQNLFIRDCRLKTIEIKTITQKLINNRNENE